MFFIWGWIGIMIGGRGIVFLYGLIIVKLLLILGKSIIFFCKFLRLR